MKIARQLRAFDGITVKKKFERHRCALRIRVLVVRPLLWLLAHQMQNFGQFRCGAGARGELLRVIRTNLLRVRLAASLGFEPRQRDPESLVLPLHHEATSGEKLKADWTRAQPTGRGR